jgi:hypothetical protein
LSDHVQPLRTGDGLALVLALAAGVEEGDCEEEGEGGMEGDGEVD